VGPRPLLMEYLGCYIMRGVLSVRLLAPTCISRPCTLGARPGGGGMGADAGRPEDTGVGAVNVYALGQRKTRRRFSLGG
jgi:hypothetical protein